MPPGQPSSATRQTPSSSNGHGCSRRSCRPPCARRTPSRAGRPSDRARRSRGPGAGWLEFHPKIAAVLRRAVKDAITAEETPSAVFGYTLVGDWLARRANGDPMPTPRGVPLSIGPCVVTADELDPQTAFVTVRIDGEEWVKGNLNGTALGLLRDVARASKQERLEPGETFASGPFEIPGFEHRVWPGPRSSSRPRASGSSGTASGGSSDPVADEYASGECATGTCRCRRPSSLRRSRTDGSRPEAASSTSAAAPGPRSASSLGSAPRPWGSICRSMPSRSPPVSTGPGAVQADAGRLPFAAGSFYSALDRG